MLLTQTYWWVFANSEFNRGKGEKNWIKQLYQNGNSVFSLFSIILDGMLWQRFLTKPYFLKCTTYIVNWMFCKQFTRYYIIYIYLFSVIRIKNPVLCWIARSLIYSNPSKFINRITSYLKNIVHSWSGPGGLRAVRVVQPS